jgi:hypothetical protein
MKSDYSSIFPFEILQIDQVIAGWITRSVSQHKISSIKSPSFHHHLPPHRIYCMKLCEGLKPSTHPFPKKADATALIHNIVASAATAQHPPVSINETNSSCYLMLTAG